LSPAAFKITSKLVFSSTACAACAAAGAPAAATATGAAAVTPYLSSNSLIN